MEYINRCYAEYLYILSNYEKGKFATSSHFSILKRHRLKESIRMMSLMVCVLEGTDCSKNELDAFIQRNCGRIFPVDCDCSESSEYPFTSTAGIEVVGLMKVILNELKSILDKTWITKKDKIKVAYLLRAFHNLPRSFFNLSSKLYLDCESAMQYAKDWLRRIPND